jgi:hypothetical protein
MWTGISIRWPETGGQPNRLYLNNGTSDPWNGVAGADIANDAITGFGVALADVGDPASARLLG